MGFAIRPDGAIVAETLEEAIALQRRIREGAPAVAPKRPQGAGTVGLTQFGFYRFRLRRPDGTRVNRSGFRTREEAEAALEAVVVAGAEPPPRRRRQPRCSRCHQLGHKVSRCAARAAEELPDEQQPDGPAPMFPAWQDDPPRVGDVDRPAPAAPIYTETAISVQIAEPAADWTAPLAPGPRALDPAISAPAPPPEDGGGAGDPRPLPSAPAPPSSDPSVEGEKQEV